ncbi:hypothetical protein TNCV_14751 [Trichonephila clavipes]|nr:hypothetical protein TNCV_14751 [Trichonephila clavipes]
MEIPQAINKVLIFKTERAQILSVDPDAVEQPVTVEGEREKVLSRDSSNVPPISANDETFDNFYEKGESKDNESQDEERVRLKLRTHDKHHLGRLCERLGVKPDPQNLRVAVPARMKNTFGNWRKE